MRESNYLNSIYFGSFLIGYGILQLVINLTAPYVDDSRTLPYIQFVIIYVASTTLLFYIYKKGSRPFNVLQTRFDLPDNFFTSMLNNERLPSILHGQ